MNSLMKDLKGEVASNIALVKRSVNQAESEARSLVTGAVGAVTNFFDATKFNVEVEVDKPNDLNMHIAGGAVTGLVTIRASAPATVRGFSLKHAVRIAWDQVAYADHEEEGNQDRMVHSANSKVKKSKPVYATEVLLFGSRKGAPVIVQAGEYRYPFSIVIPPWMPGSFSAQTVSEFTTCCDCCCKCCGTTFVKGGVRHSIDVQVVIAHSIWDKDHSREINVQRAAENEHLHMPKPISTMITSASAPACCCFGGGEQAALDIHLPRRDWIIGVDESIVGYINGSATSDFEVALVSQLKVDPGRAKGQLRNKKFGTTETVACRYVQHCAARSTSSRVDNVFFELKLPADLPASFGEAASKCFSTSVEYFVCVKPSDKCCTTRYEHDVHIPVLLSKALAAPKIHEPQMMPNNMMMMPPNMAIADDAAIEQCYAYCPPPATPVGVVMQQDGGGGGGGHPSSSFIPAAPIVEEGLPNAVWGVPVRIDQSALPKIDFGDVKVNNMPQQMMSPHPMM